MKNLLFWNKGEEDGFFEVGEVSGEVFRKLRVGRGAAFADYDNDGDVDIVVVNHSGPLLLLRNDGGNKNNWLKVRLQGGRKNRFGVGARIEVVAGGKRQIQEIGSQSSYLSQNPFEALFGMGKSSRVDRITVTFPGGKRQERHDLPVNQIVVIKEVE